MRNKLAQIFDQKIPLEKRYLFLVVLFSSLLLVFGIIQPKSEIVANETQNNIAGTWQGDLDPPTSTGNFGSDISEGSSSIKIVRNNPLNTNEAIFTTTGSGAPTTGHLISATIDPDLASFKAWKQIAVSVRQPKSNSYIHFDILCGEALGCGGVPFNAQLPGYVDRTATDGVLDISSIIYKKIRIRANWWRQTGNAESPALQNWSTSWTTHSGVALVITKTPNPANPQAYACESGCAEGLQNNSLVTYTVSYEINRSLSNQRIELDYPTGTYGSTVYGITPVNTNGSFDNNTKKVYWIPSGSAGSLTASFRVNTGPPDAVVFKTKARLTGNESGNPVSYESPEDRLNIEAKSVIRTRLDGPNQVAANSQYTYFLSDFSAQIPYQGDIYNAVLVFTYSPCVSYVSQTNTRGQTPTVNTAARTVTYPPFNYVVYPNTNYFTITVRANATCGGMVDSRWEILSADQIPTLLPSHLRTHSASFNSSPDISIIKDSRCCKNPVGPNQRIIYNLLIDQKTSLGINNFYLIDQIPAQTYFLNANFIAGYLTSVSASPPIPNNRNPVSIWVSGSTTEPAKNDPSWQKISTANFPQACPTACAKGDPNTPDPTVKWVKYQVDNLDGATPQLFWDRLLNQEFLLAKLEVVTQSSLTGASIGNTAKAYGTNACLAPAGCTSNSVSSIIKDEPYFQLSYSVLGSNLVNSGDEATLIASACNCFDSSSGSTSDAKNVKVVVKLPNLTYLDLANPVVSAKAECLGVPDPQECPDINGDPVTNAPWLDAIANGGLNLTNGTITWNIPLIYNGNKWPQKMPYNYRFLVRIKTRLGVVNNTNACSGNCTIYIEGQNSKLSLPTPGVTRTQAMVPEMIITSTPQVSVNKTGPDTVLINSPLTYTISFTNTGNGGAPSTAIIEAIPQNVDYSPPSLTYFESYTSNSGNSVWWMSGNRDDAYRPDRSDPGWKNFNTQPPADKTLVDWFKWEIGVLDAGSTQSVTLTVTTVTAPNGIIYQNTAFLQYIDETGSTKVASNNHIVTVQNPGFVTADNGNVGSASDINFQQSVPTGGYSSNIEYLGIGQNIQLCCIKSLKQWLLNDYTIDVTRYVDYDKFWKEYGRDAKTCSNVNGCLGTEGGDGGVKIFDATNAPFTIDTTTNNTYTLKPLILFINAQNSSSLQALAINANFSIAANTGLIFVVKGHVQVNSLVTNIDGVYLVDGEFATGKNTLTTGNKDAGRLAAISIGRDKFARIVYLTDKTVRFIRCLDLDCINRGYSFITTLSNITSMFMELDQSTSQDLPRIVIGQDVGGATKTYYAKCNDENCSFSQVTVTTIDNAIDPDIALDRSAGNLLPGGFHKPIISEALNNSTPDKVLAHVSCNDINCTGHSNTSLDGGANNNNKGYYSQIELDRTVNPPVPVITYVEKGGSQANMWMARKRSSGNGNGCNAGINGWDCLRMSTTNQGDVGRYPSMALVDGYVRVAYNNTTYKGLEYMDCGTNATLKLCEDKKTGNSIEQVRTIVVDCPGGNECEVQDYVSLKMDSANNPRIVYNVKQKNNPDPACVANGCYDVRFAYCNSQCFADGSSWVHFPLIQDIRGTGSGPGVEVFTQALALGPELSGNNADYPRIVVYRADSADLYYIRCKTAVCAPADPNQFTSLTIDSGGPISVQDVQLTVRGSVMAYGKNSFSDKAIRLQRDLFGSSSSLPGEIFIFEPKYFYLFREIIKEPEYIKETPP